MDARCLLISDVDGTLLGEDESLARFAQWYAAHREEIVLAYSSGRFFESVAESIRTTALPSPAAIIGGVGTEIRRYPDGEPVDGLFEHLTDWDADRVRETLENFSQLESQPEYLQSEYKVSYYAHDVPKSFLDELDDALRGVGLRAQIVYSSRRDLDVLPEQANKGTAAAFLARCWQAKPERVVVSGDSGNDLAMFQQGFRGIVVSNAHPELISLEGPRVYQSPHAFAAGVLDGMQYWWDRLSEPHAAGAYSS